MFGRQKEKNKLKYFKFGGPIQIRRKKNPKPRPLQLSSSDGN